MMPESSLALWRLYPLRAKAAEEFLKGKPIDEETAVKQPDWHLKEQYR